MNNHAAVPFPVGPRTPPSTTLPTPWRIDNRAPTRRYGRLVAPRAARSRAKQISLLCRYATRSLQLGARAQNNASRTQGRFMPRLTECARTGSRQ